MSTKTRNINNLDPTVVQEALTRQVATIMLSGATVTDCAKRLTITPAAVRRITATDKYKELVTVTAEDELAPALSQAKAQLARLTTKAIKAVERALDEGSARDSLQAATIVLKAVGLHEEKEQQNDTSITVVLPSGLEAPITYEVKE
jgi:hypothetical protein